MAEINVFINGTVREVAQQTDLAGLLRQLSLSEKRVAVELNGTVISRADWPQTNINDGDRVEIVHFVGGG